jgi:hypothetical protein
MLSEHARVIQLNRSDDVVIACQEIPAGTHLDEYGLTVRDPVPAGHRGVSLLPSSFTNPKGESLDDRSGSGFGKLIPATGRCLPPEYATNFNQEQLERSQSRLGRVTKRA